MQHCEFSEVHSILLFFGNASRGGMTARNRPDFFDLYRSASALKTVSKAIHRGYPTSVDRHRPDATLDATLFNVA